MSDRIIKKISSYFNNIYDKNLDFFIILRNMIISFVILIVVLSIPIMLILFLFPEFKDKNIIMAVSLFIGMCIIYYLFYKQLREIEAKKK